MKYIDEYRNPEFIGTISKEIHELAKKIPHPINLMEVCGTHTMAIGKFGIRQILPENIKLISGPGCPVCVTPDSYIDRIITLSRKENVVITTFGDMIKVPGSFSSLEKEKSAGSDIKVVYSPLEAIDIAEKSPDKKVVFSGIGFETTAPAVALTIKKAEKKGIKNFYVLCGHKLIPPAMEALMEDKEVKIDGFICPGHVSVIIGSAPYLAISQRYNVPCVISGFEPLDIIQSIFILIKKWVEDKKTDVEIQYKRVVREKGNIKARKVLEEVFDIVDSEWRGLGVIRKSGLAIKEKYRDIDADFQFSTRVKKGKKRCGCICGDILKGKKIPPDCKMFRRVCTPENPLGPCMVSSEGSCAAYYRYGNK
ncbi:MAG TPA: hydrogenase formation protein HypD [bacterium]|mgnify:CR=1 FL=1|nr:hydrogenase formation protein HypD [bacterium]